MKNYAIKSMILATLVAFVFTPVAHAQQKRPSKTAVQHAAAVSQICPKAWSGQACLATMSESNLVMAANYAATLQEKGHKDAAEEIKEHCAAATAATRGEYPAYAMRSAFVDCANTIVDTSNDTGITPDQSHYQLLVGAVFCLDGDRRCSIIEQGLKKY